MTAYICFVGLAIIIPSYAIISSWSALGSLQFLILACIAGEATFGLIIGFGNFGGIYCESKELIFSLKKYKYFTKRNEKELHAKEVKSLQSFKVKIGSVNYIDQHTPFRLIEFCFDRVVDLLLVQ